MRTPTLPRLLALGLVTSTGLAQGVPLAPFATYTGNEHAAESGWAVASADLDLDGYDDVILGAPQAQNDLGGGQVLTFAGRVVAFSGKTGAILVDFRGDTGQVELGFAVAVLPDVDGDTFPDLLVGAPTIGSSIGPLPFAQVRSGKTGDVLRTYEGSHPFERFGSAVACAGDVNGDGEVDYLVGGPGATNANPGIVRMFSGITNDPTAVVLWQRSGTTNENVGKAVCALGDADGDGTPDVAVGAPCLDSPAQQNSGGVVLMRGQDGSPTKLVVPPAGILLFGTSLGRLGKANNDAVDDLAVGAIGGLKSPIGSNGLAMAVDPKTGAKIRTFVSPVADTTLGYSVAGVGDVTGDGVDDLAAGAYGGTGTSRSYALVFSGATGLLVGNAAADNPASLASTNGSLAGRVDVNGDGVADLVAGAWDTVLPPNVWAGNARVFSLGSLNGLGNKGKLRAKIALQRPALAPPDPDANGSVTLEVNGLLQTLGVDLNKIADPLVTQLFAFVEDAVGSQVFVEVLQLTKKSASGKWQGKLTDPSGLPPALDAQTIPELAGRAVEIRDGMGVVLLTAVMPDITGADDFTLKLPMLPPQGAPLPAASGTLALSFKQSTGSQSVVLSTKGLSSAGAYSFYLEEPSGSQSFTPIAPLVKGKYSVDTKNGAPLPLGIPTLDLLAGRTVEVREGATVVLRVEIPG